MMPFVFSKAQKSVATFIIIGLFFLVAVVVLIGKGSGVFERKANYITFFDEGHGLTEGSAIKYKDFTVGKIRIMELTDEDNIKVLVQFDKKYSDKLVKLDTLLMIKGGSILGGGGLEIISSMDDPSPHMEPGSLIFSSDMDEGVDLMLAYESGQTQDDLMANVDNILNMILSYDPLITSILDNLDGTTESVSAILGGLQGTDYSLLSSEIIGSLDTVNSMLDTVEQDILAEVTETVYALTSDLQYILNSVTKDITAIMNNVNQTVVDVDGLVTNINGMLNTDISDLLTQLSGTLSTVDGMLTGIEDDVMEILANVNTLTEEEVTETLILLQEDLIELKKVMQNLPLGIGTGSTVGGSSIQGGDR